MLLGSICPQENIFQCASQSSLSNRTADLLAQLMSSSVSSVVTSTVVTATAPGADPISTNHFPSPP